eukprot:COSAG01_NODE_8851_length_2637_cov_6.265957_5_plen_97_part_00
MRAITCDSYFRLVLFFTSAFNSFREVIFLYYCYPLIMVRSELFYHGCHVYAVALSVCLHPAFDAVAAAAPNQAAKDESPLAYYKSVLLSTSRTLVA